MADQQVAYVRGLVVTLVFVVGACDRPTAPGLRGVSPANVPTLSLASALDVHAEITDQHLLSDSKSACARGLIMAQPSQSSRNPGIRVVATRVADGSLVRFRTTLSADGVADYYFEMTRDWNGVRGIRVAQWKPGATTLWVLRYGPGGNGRVMDQREEHDSASIESFERLRTLVAKLDCPAKLNHVVNHDGLLVRWDGPVLEKPWRELWPPRPTGRDR